MHGPVRRGPRVWIGCVFGSFPVVETFLQDCAPDIRREAASKTAQQSLEVLEQPVQAAAWQQTASTHLVVSTTEALPLTCNANSPLARAASWNSPRATARSSLNRQPYAHSSSDCDGDRRPRCRNRPKRGSGSRQWSAQLAAAFALSQPRSREDGARRLSPSSVVDRGCRRSARGESEGHSYRYGLVLLW